MKKLVVIAGLILAATACSSNVDTPEDTMPDTIDAVDDVQTPDGAADAADEGRPDNVAGDEGADAVDTVTADAADSDATDAVDATDVPELPIYAEPAVRVLFDLLGSQVESPFPSDHYINADDGTIKIASKGWNNSLLYLIEMDFPSYSNDASLMKGFALYSTLAFLTSAAVDPATLPATGEASLGDASAVKLYRVDGDQLVEQQIMCSFNRFDDPKIFNVTQCRPLYKLEPDSTHIFVITDGLKDIDGNAFQRSRGFMQALGLARVESEAPAERLDLMHGTGETLAAALSLLQDASHVAGASVFTTGHPNTEMEDVMSLFKDGEPVQPVDYNLDADGDGNSIIYAGSALPHCALGDEYMAWGLHGHFTAPEFRNAEGRFERDESGKFRTFTGEEISFYLMVPEGEGPFPVVIAQHGLASEEHGMCNISRELVRRDFAVLRFLWPEHGFDREDTRGNGTTDFIDVLNPARIAYNFMQSATEIASAVILLDQLNADMTPLRPEGDGLPPLDTSRIAYVGHSLGSIIALLYLPFSDRIDILVSNAGGVGLSHLVDVFLEQFFPGLKFIGSAVVNLADHIVAVGDGVSNAEKLLAEPVQWASGPKYILAQEIIGDQVVANESTEVLARNSGLKQINPVSVTIEGVDSADPADVTSGLFQFTGTDHHQFTSTSGSVPDAERFQAWHYLETGLRNGIPEIKVFEPVTE